MTTILHIARRSEWAHALAGPSRLYRPPSLATDGFIHCSTIEQAVETANRCFPGQLDLVLLCLDEKDLGAELKCEGPSSPRACDGRAHERFPHICAPLDVSSVARVVPFVPAWRLPLGPMPISQLAG